MEHRILARICPAGDLTLRDSTLRSLVLRRYLAAAGLFGVSLSSPTAG